MTPPAKGVDPNHPLRARLLALRRDALAQLAAADHVDAGLLRLVADAGAVLAVLDRAEREDGTDD